MSKNNVLLFLQKVKLRADDAIECHERLSGLLRYYHRKAACAFDVAGKGGAASRPLVSAVLARGVCAEIPLFFYGAEIAAAKMLLFFRKSA